MVTREEVKEYLSKNHKGKRNAVHSKELEQHFLMTGRSLRRMISALRMDGEPICSDETGYYYADSQNEINKTVGRLNCFVIGISNARTGLLYSTVMKSEGINLEITIRVLEGENDKSG